jgi:RNA polymerase sigma factor (sigma-70 family)
VRQALLGLSRDHREVLVLRFYADLSERQVAEVLRVPAGTVKSRTARALAALASGPALTGLPGDRSG